jgi:hypothetical protein
MLNRSKCFLLVLTCALTSCSAAQARADVDAIQARGERRNGTEGRIGGASIASAIVLPDFYEQRELCST